MNDIRQRLSRGAGVLSAVIAISLAGMAIGAEPETSPASQAALIDALKDFNAVIGNWRGIGQVKRGSPQGALPFPCRARC